MNSVTNAALIGLKNKWQAVNPRYQLLVVAASALMLLTLVWSTMVAPPLKFLRHANHQQRTLDAETQKMQSLQAQAQHLLGLPKTSRDETLRALKASAVQLDPAVKLDVTGDRAILVVRAVPAEALAQWLAQARTNAHTQPLEASLTLTVGRAAQWDGQFVLGLPAK